MERRFFSSFTRLAAGKVPLKENECCARGSAKAINRLVRISDRKDVAFFPGQPLQDFHLGKIDVLKFVHQDEPAARPKRARYPAATVGRRG